MGFLAKRNGKEPTANGIMIIVLWARSLTSQSFTRSTFRLNSGIVDHFFCPFVERLLSQILTLSKLMAALRENSCGFIGFWAIRNRDLGSGSQVSALPALPSAANQIYEVGLVPPVCWVSVVVRSLWDSLLMLFRNLGISILPLFFSPIFFGAFLRLSAFPSDYNTNMQGFLSENKDKKRLLLIFLGLNFNTFNILPTFNLLKINAINDF